MQKNRKDKLKTKLFERAIKFGEFTLASGLKSNYYINGKMATLDSEALNHIAEIVLDMIEDCGCDAVGGPTIGADPIVGAVLALAHNRGRKLKGFIIRKAAKGHGTKSLIEGPLDKGDRAVILEDVITTGGSAIKAVEALKDFGCEVVKIIVIVDREQGAEENIFALDIPFEAIFTKSELGL